MVLADQHRDYIPMEKRMAQWINDDTFSDVTLVVENERIHAHRVVLASGSEYFKKMFSSGMKESKQREITIPNVSKNAFMLLLEYLYTGEISDQATLEDLLNLSQAGDMFDLPRLQDLCAEDAKEELTIDTAADFLREADMHNCRLLKETSMEYVRQNFEQISVTPGMSTLPQELILEVIRGYRLVDPNMEIKEDDIVEEDEAQEEVVLVM